MKIFIASDHAGFDLKTYLIEKLQKETHEVIDCGAHELVEGDDYPEYIAKAARAVSEVEIARRQGALEHHKDLEVRGIVIGGSGQGEAITANRFEAVRAAVYYGGPEEIVKLSRTHNDSNIISLGARFLSHAEAHRAVTLWLSTPFSGVERHERRINEIDLESDKDTLYN